MRAEPSSSRSSSRRQHRAVGPARVAGPAHRQRPSAGEIAQAQLQQLEVGRRASAPRPGRGRDARISRSVLASGGGREATPRSRASSSARPSPWICRLAFAAGAHAASNIASRSESRTVRAVIAAERDFSASDRTGLEIALDRPLPAALPVGQATAVFCVGTCFHRHQRIDGPGDRGRRRAPPADGAAHAAARPLSGAAPDALARPAASAERDPDSSRDPGAPLVPQRLLGDGPDRAQRRNRATLELSVEARLADGTTERAALGTIDDRRAARAARRYDDLASGRWTSP